MAQIALKMPIYSAIAVNTLIMKFLGLFHAPNSNSHSFFMSGQPVACYQVTVAIYMEIRSQLEVIVCCSFKPKILFFSFHRESHRNSMFKAPNGYETHTKYCIRSRSGHKRSRNYVESRLFGTYILVHFGHIT